MAREVGFSAAAHWPTWPATYWTRVLGLKLKYPVSVEASCTPVNQRDVPAGFDLSIMSIRPREGMPAVQVHWYDGGPQASASEALELAGRLDQASSNVLFIGSKGVLRCGEYGDNPQLVPSTDIGSSSRTSLPQTLKRIRTGHEGNWLEAIQTRRQHVALRLTRVPSPRWSRWANLAIPARERRARSSFGTAKNARQPTTRRPTIRANALSRRLVADM